MTGNFLAFIKIYFDFFFKFKFKQTQSPNILTKISK